MLLDLIRQINDFCTRNNPIKSYTIIDFETTGLNPKSNRFIEIGALKIINNSIVREYTTLVNPQKNITKKITQLTGITNEMLFDAPLEQDVFPEFVRFIQGLPICAYNVNFDINFLSETLKRINIGMRNVECFDALKIARNNFAGLENYKLETVIKSIDPSFEQSHRALSDCYAVHKILKNFNLTRTILE